MSVTASYRRIAEGAFTNKAGDTPMREIKPLTSLRFIAALAVLIEHLPMIPGLEWMRQHNLALGKIGVTTFFVLSGYIISVSYFDKEWTRDFRGNCLRFYWTRFARIYPLHWFVFLFALPLGLASPTSPVNPWHIPLLATLTDGLWPGFHPSPQPVKAAWTLSCELVFYLVAPFVLLLLQESGRPVRTAGLLLVTYTAAILWATTQWPTANWIAYARVPEFLLGILAFVVTQKRDLSRMSAFILLLGLAILLFGPQSDDSRQNVMSFWAPALGAMLVILGFSAATGRLAYVLSVPALVLLGHASYAIYLLHDPILRYARVLVVEMNTEFPGASGIWVALVLLAIIIVSAICTYRLVETPARRYLRSLMQPSPKQAADRTLEQEPAGV
jgi:peptidoglycan/LPS O-acetylase OafA/YrhL